MATEKSLTFEDVNAHVEQHLTDAKLQSMAAAAPNLCSIYAIARPILVLISQFVLIPQKWRDGIKILISALDALCPQGAETTGN
ncbi:MAG TPA: hypothetical protein VHE59_20135 [Mucilaginibacter sp.]|nr:hypothetical protein [Mucilaginibacter sp.]